MARRGTEGEWRKRLKRWASFDGSVTAFCADEGVSTKAFYNWRKRLRRGRAGNGAIELVEVERVGTTASVELVVNDIVVRVCGAFDSVALHRVLDVLAERR